MGGEDCIKVYNRGTWQTARRLLSSIASPDRDIYFRGQADSAWRLESSFGRLVGRLRAQRNWKGGDRNRIEDELQRHLFREFRNAHRRIPGAPPLPEKEDNEFLALAQHYSLPTRLLDWSRSPYIAAFFAFDGCKTTVFPSDHKVAIWALDWEMFELFLYYSYVRPKKVSSKRPRDLAAKLKTMRSTNSPRIDKVEISGNPNRRMVYQEGLFTRAIKVEDDIESYLRSRSQYAPGTILTKTVVPGSQQAEALKDLSLMTINPVTLMNDADGAAATAFNSVVRFRSA